MGDIESKGRMLENLNYLVPYLAVPCLQVNTKEELVWKAIQMSEFKWEIYNSN